MLQKKKMGRPTDSVKNHEIKARVNEELFKKLNDFSKKNNLNYAQIIRNALSEYLSK